MEGCCFLMVELARPGMPLMSNVLTFGLVICTLLAAGREVSSDADIGAPRIAGGDNVEGVMSRAESFVSGSFAYRLRWGHRPDDEPLYDGGGRYAFMGDSWTHWFLNKEGQFVNPTMTHEGRHLILSGTPQRDSGTMAHSLQIREELTRQFRFSDPHTYAFNVGTILFPHTIAFIRSHVSEAQYIGTDTVDGSPVQVLEWSVPSTDIAAFVMLLPAITNEGGLIRVFTSPELGFAIPKYQCTGPDGTIAYEVIASDFFEASPGFYLPRSTHLQSYAPEEGYYVMIDITDATSVNGVVPESEFKFEIPIDTFVSDSRAGNQISYQANTILSTDSLEGWLAETREARHPPNQPRDSTWRLIVVGNVVAVVIFGCVVFFRRRG